MVDHQRLTVWRTRLGWFAVAWRGTTVESLTFGHSTPLEALRRLRGATGEPGSPDAFMRRLAARLRSRASGDCGDTFDDIAIDTDDLTDFQRSVTNHCRLIPVGQTISYGELASWAGHPGAARAVGQVMATNRFPLIVPCHRVVSSNSLGGFSSPEGLAMKRRLLDAEAAHAARASSPRSSARHRSKRARVPSV